MLCLVVEHIEERGTPAIRAEQVSRPHHRRHVLGVTQRRDGGVPRVHRMHHRPLPVRVLVHNSYEYLR